MSFETTGLGHGRHRSFDDLGAAAVTRTGLSRRANLAVGMAAAVLMGCAPAWAQSRTSDAQVESSVLRALASAPELSSQPITTNTVYGVVTLSGSVASESLRKRAETLTSTTPGVVKVVDELTLGSEAAPPTSADAGAALPAGMVLQSDGSYAPIAPGQNADGSIGTGAPAPPVAGVPAAGATPTYQRNNPEEDQGLDQLAEEQAQGNQGNTAGAPQPDGRRPLNDPQSGSYGYPQNGSQASQGTYPAGGYPQNGYPQNGYPQNGYPQNGYPQGGAYGQNGYPAANGPQAGYPNPGSYPGGNSYPGNGYPQNGYPNGNSGQGGGYPQANTARGYGAPQYAAPMDGGQVAGEVVTVPSGTLVRVRVNERLASNHSQPGDAFDGVVTNDVVAGSAIAIPRGAAVQGRVVDSKSSGVLAGRGELSLELTQVTLGGRSYPIVSDQWAHNGADKTLQTINRTAGVGAFGAIVGAIAGGGEGAAIGAGVGAAAGLGSSAASGRGQVDIPSESVITFHLAQPATVQTVSEQEMQRLATGVPPGADRRQRPQGYYGRPAPYGYGYPY